MRLLEDYLDRLQVGGALREYLREHLETAAGEEQRARSHFFCVACTWHGPISETIAELDATGVLRRGCPLCRQRAHRKREMPFMDHVHEFAAMRRVLFRFGAPSGQHVSLAQLDGLTVSWLEHCAFRGRPLLSHERRITKNLLATYESAQTKTRLLQIPDAEAAYHRSQIAALQLLADPPPIVEPRLQRQKPETVAELHAGNFALVTRPFAGVSQRRLTSREATELVYQIGTRCDDIAQAVRELALARHRDRTEAAQIVTAAARVVTLARAFAGRCLMTGIGTLTGAEPGAAPVAGAELGDYLDVQHQEQRGQNGLYVVTQIGEGRPFVLVRATGLAMNGHRCIATDGPLPACVYARMPALPTEPDLDETMAQMRTLAALMAPLRGDEGEGEGEGEGE